MKRGLSNVKKIGILGGMSYESTIKLKSKRRLLEIINSYEIDGVILGCTELPLILDQMDTEIKLLDTIELHINAAFNYYSSLQ